MTTTPIVFGIYSFYDKNKDATISYKIPYINSFEITKDVDKISVQAIVRLPKNIYYDFTKSTKDTPTINDILTSNKSESPYFYEAPNEIQLPTGLQILDQENNATIGQSSTGDDIKRLNWVSIDRLNGSLIGRTKASDKLLEKSIFGPTPLSKDSYWGKVFTFDNTFNTDKAQQLTIDSQTLNFSKCNIVKFSKTYQQDDTSKKFSVGDLFTIRHGFLSDAIDSNDSNKNSTKDNLLTDTFYITKVIPTKNEIELHLENWTWKMRQIPCRGTITKDLTLIEFLKEYLFPIILKETYINAIITRDAETNLPRIVNLNEPFSNLTDNLITNKITKGFYFPVTNFYDILVTLKEKFLLTFSNLDYLSPSVTSCSIGYGYRDMTNGAIYSTQKNIIKKDITFVNYDDYKVLVRVTSNKELKPGELKKFKATIKKGTTQEEYNRLEAEYKKKAQVIFGDRSVLGMIRSNNAKLGQQTLQNEGNLESSNLVNINKLWVPNENLELYAKTFYNKLKFATEFNSITVKGPSNTYIYGGLNDIISITDRQDPSITGVYIVSSTSVNMSVQDGYTKSLKLGVRIPKQELPEFMIKIKS